MPVIVLPSGVGGVGVGGPRLGVLRSRRADRIGGRVPDLRSGQSSRAAGLDVEPVEVVGVDDPVGVALLGEEPLPVLRRSPRRRCRGRRPCRSARSARRPWAAAAGRAAGPPPGASRTCPDTWIATAASGRSMEKFATLETTSSVDLAGAERLEEPLPLLDRGLALDHRRVERARRARRAGRGTARSPASARPRCCSTSSLDDAGSSRRVQDASR